ncbi:MAG: hypothetical protein B2I17_05970 [Thermoplasmatales archaeon B_DKE]|nr:MAG: hypothetical protein B2I17_05970 [Thermoplasmatales archaeon B_DKE]
MKYEEGRRQKALEIAVRRKTKQEREHWIVPSQSGSHFVCYAMNEPICTCPDFENRKVACKHIIAVELTKYRIVDREGNVIIQESKRVTYSQDWTSYNIAQNEEVKLFDQLLSDLVSSVEDAS